MMNWMFPASVSTFVVSATVAGIYWYLASVYRERYLRLWAWSWTTYAFRFLFLLAELVWGGHWGATFGYMGSSIAHAMLLLGGTEVFTRGVLSAHWAWLGAAALAWTGGALAAEVSPTVLSTPIFALQALADFLVAIALLRSVARPRPPALVFTSVCFFVWGVHKLDYPLLRFVDWFAPVGYTLGAFFGLATALGILLIFFERTRCLLTARSRQLEAQVDERRRAEEALRESESRLSTILDNVGAHIFIKDTRYRYTYANRTVCELLGHPPEEIQGRDDSAFFSPASAEEIRRSDRPVIEEGRTVTREETDLTAADGVPHTFWTVKLPLRDGSGKVTGLCGISTDISERRRAEQALRDRNRYIETILESAPIGFAVNTMDDGEVVFVGSKFEEIYGLPRGSLHSVAEFFETVYPDPELREQIRTRVLADMATGDPARMRWEDSPITTATGEQRFVTATNIPLPDQNLMVSTVQDVTARHRAEEAQEYLQTQLAQAQKMESIGRLAGGVAHDFNNMLTVILGHAELALARADSPPSVQGDLVAIQRAAEHSADLTRQLLAFARKQPIAPMVLDLNETVGGILKMLRRLIGEDIDLAWMPGANLWPVRLDPSQIDQLLANLCVNARDAIADEGKVTIETHNVHLDDAYCARHAGASPGAYVMLAVSDDGCGMEKRVLDHLFEPFFTTKAIGEGTGLGLATVYGIVKQNEGFIAVYSEPGKGTTFKVYLNRAPGEAPDVKASSGEQPLQGRGETVLLVEDDQDILDMGRSMLERLGYTVLTAGTPHEAMRHAETHAEKIDLLLTDVVMPEMNGRVLAERVAAIRPDVRCLFVSGYTANVIADRGVVDGGIHFLSKPYSMGALARKIREILETG